VDLKVDLSGFSERLIAARVRKYSTGAECERHTGIPQVTLRTYETGKNYPNLYNAVLIAKALDVSLDWLCGIGKLQEEIKC
jgi:transcriptional regulator with XRE-family HTH domain